ECKIDIRLSFVGKINWNAHIMSSAQLKNIKKSAGIPSKTLLLFFNKTSSPLEAPCGSSTISPFCLCSLLTPGSSPTLLIAQHLSESVACLSVTSVLESSLVRLLSQLKAVIDSLPVEVPYGIDSDDLAVFAGSLRTHIQQDNEAWESLDPLLNQFGMDGMYTWVKVCIEELNISEIKDYIIIKM
ncbi:hypothetical protein K443DRAFT_108865, partial [Laccaria amethystina LaAM-08-1]